MTKFWTEEEYTDHRFGFPVHLLNIPMKEVRGEAVPMLNGKVLRLAVLSALVVKPGPLYGSEVRFIRLWLGLTLSAFGQELGVTHAAVKKWETQGDEPTGTNRVNDFYIRYLVLERLLQEEPPWMDPSDAPAPLFIQKFREVLTEKRESPQFLQRVRETISREIGEPVSAGSQFAFSVTEIPQLATKPSVG